MKTDILFEKHFIYVPKLEIKDKEASAYYAAYLLTNYGIEITNPEYLDINALSVVEDVFSLTVPPSFYENPQDTRYFSCEDLYLEQIFSYFFNYGSSDKRIELFNKALPKYFIGTECKIRTYEIIDEEKAKPILIEYGNSLASYKRPFSSTEKKRFRYLVEEGYIDINRVKICSKDNIFEFLYEYPFLASQLDLKDIVKYSIYLFGEDENFTEMIKKQNDRIDAFRQMLLVVKKCPLSKKQAKYLNRIYKVCGLNNRLSNVSSPYRLMKEKLKEGDVIGAAEAIRNSGSLFLRNVKYLISRAKNEEEVNILIDMIPNNNPSILYQLLSNIHMDRYERPRVFKFVKPNTVACIYKESDYETHYRKSVIRSDFVPLVSKKLVEKLKEYYSSLPKLGKVYVSEKFKNIALPVNTAACGNGLDVLPIGSRIPFSADYLRTFCYWHDALDIDASLAIISEEEFLKNDYNSNFALSWRTYSEKYFGDFALCSGDDTSRDGAEYQDIDIHGLVRMGYRYAVFCINGYGQTFERGQIRCGVQIKKRLNNKAWDPKNIEFQIDIKGACRSFTCFALDMIEKEIIIINMKSNFGSVIEDEQVAMAFNYLDEHYLDFNMYEVASLRGEVTDNIEEADVVFDDDYSPKENQQVIRTFDVAKLAELSK